MIAVALLVPCIVTGSEPVFITAAVIHILIATPPEIIPVVLARAVAVAIVSRPVALYSREPARHICPASFHLHSFSQTGLIIMPNKNNSGFEKINRAGENPF
jgi:hypothetical protein